MGTILEGLAADSLPRIMDINATKLIELGLVIPMFFLAKSFCFYEKKRWQLLGRSNLRATEMDSRDHNKTDLLPAASMINLCGHTDN